MRIGENGKWKELWRDMGSRLMAYLSSFGGLSREDREDLVQRAFTRAWETRGSLREGLGMRAWFHRVARNQALDFLKGRGREERRFPRAAEDEEGKAAEAPGSYPDPEAAALDAEKAAFMESFVAGLGQAERELVHLRWAEGMGFGEISRVTGEAAGTLTWRASRIRGKLEEAWRKEFGT